MKMKLHEVSRVSVVNNDDHEAVEAYGAAVVGCLRMVEPVVAPDVDQGLVLTDVLHDHC